jgi:hypothetical protein
MPIKKLKKLDNTNLNGTNSKGSIFCLNIAASVKNELVASTTAAEKNSQGNIPESTKKVKFSIFILKTLVKIMFMQTARIKGMIIAHHNPNIAPE